MRKVKFKRWIKAKYEGDDHSGGKFKVAGTGKYEDDYLGKGLFHQWGVNYEEFETNAGCYSIALVERPDGTMTEVLPINIKFEKS